MGFKHLVILGAGSTIATIPNGDKNGEKALTLAFLLADPFLAPFVERNRRNKDPKTCKFRIKYLYLQ